MGPVRSAVSFGVGFANGANLRAVGLVKLAAPLAACDLHQKVARSGLTVAGIGVRVLDMETTTESATRIVAIVIRDSDGQVVLAVPAINQEWSKS